MPCWAWQYDWHKESQTLGDNETSKVIWSPSLSSLSMLNNYLNKLHAATGHFSCSRGLSHRVRCPSSLRHHPQPVPPARVPGIQRHNSAFMPPWVGQEKGALAHGGISTNNRSHLQLLEHGCMFGIHTSLPSHGPPAPFSGCMHMAAGQNTALFTSSRSRNIYLGLTSI